VVIANGRWVRPDKNSVAVNETLSFVHLSDAHVSILLTELDKLIPHRWSCTQSRVELNAINRHRHHEINGFKLRKYASSLYAPACSTSLFSSMRINRKKAAQRPQCKIPIDQTWPI
jgi:hypothetical protein